MPFQVNGHQNLVNAGREGQVWNLWSHWVQRWQWWPPTRGDGSGSSSQSCNSFNRSTAKRCPWWQWMVVNGRGSLGEQNPTGGVTQNRRKSQWSKVEKSRVFKLWSPAFWLFFGDVDGKGIMAGLQASNWYQAWPERWPEMEVTTESRSRVPGRVW